MSDLVKRLRGAKIFKDGWYSAADPIADRIEQLERAHARSQGVQADLAAMLIRAERAEAELAALRAVAAPEGRDMAVARAVWEAAALCAWRASTADEAERDIRALDLAEIVKGAAPAAPNKEVE